MNTKKISCALAIMALLSVCLNVNAQRRNRIVSPEINENNTVTFRLYAPGVDSVKLYGSWMQGWGTLVDMVREDTLWTYTTEVLAPEQYTYAFYIDRAKVLDPSNVRMVRDGTRYESMLIVPGNESDVYEVQDVPHGTLAKVWYDSPTLNMHRRMYVYTPPGYQDSKEEYPVLYLLHGGGGDEDAWTTLGRTPYIMDNLIAAGKAKPMIVVMTNGNADQTAAITDRKIKPTQPSPRGPMNSMASKAFPNSIVNDVIPYIEKHYRVLINKENRALAGLSMGALQTQITGMNNPELFNYLGVFSIGLQMEFGEVTTDLIEAYDKNLDVLKKNGFELFYVAVGKEDFVYEGVILLREKLDEHEFNYIYNETDGGHTWANWRIYLSEFAPMLFK